ncbi:M1 family metallopeptidase [Caulobacter segnis]
MSKRSIRYAVAGVIAAACAVSVAHADAIKQTKAPFDDKFRQLEGEDWPTPTDYRNAAGAPGYRYWQQKVDYDVAVRLDEDSKLLTGRETITYRNNSPDSLPYLWLLLEQDAKRNSISKMTETVSGDTISLGQVRRIQRFKDWEGGFTITSVKDASGRPLTFTVVDTLLRVDLPAAVRAHGGETKLTIEWSLPMIENKVVGGRSGYECFTDKGEDGNCIYEGAQWFPRLAVYSDYEGWHNKAFLGAGEFTLEFGDYRVALTVPSDHVVSATGVLQNAAAVLSAAQRDRLAKARTASEPVYVVTPEEALAAEKGKAKTEKTWVFQASNVRDFGWASSRKFVWDALGVKQEGDAAHPVVMAMSFFPKEARPLWDAYSTKSIAHTLKVYSDFTFAYPYPVAQSVNGPVGGMEYPMISFNGPRPVKDKKTGALTYTERAKYGLIGVVIHEVGHNYFPMIVNSDERQWTWMDEGLNSFLEFQAEVQWDKTFPSRRGEPKDIVEYMVSQDQVPLMTQSDSVIQFGPNGYSKPATALVILRETVMGRALFDRAFKEYANRWRFKHPTPYDFFRTMEESSGVDLDWFWRGWFYSTDHVDIALDKIVKARLDSGDPDVEATARKGLDAKEPQSRTAANNTGPTVVDRDPKVRDFYNETDQFSVFESGRKKAKTAREELTPEERAAQDLKDNFYRFTFRNIGGLVMPVILKMDFADGSTETVRIPAEIWRKNAKQVTWQYVSPKDLKGAELDPLWETADADRGNNVYEGAITPMTLKIQKAPDQTNRMKDANLKVEPGGLGTLPSEEPKKDEPKKDEGAK